VGVDDVSLEEDWTSLWRVRIFLPRCPYSWHSYHLSFFDCFFFILLEISFLMMRPKFSLIFPTRLAIQQLGEIDGSWSWSQQEESISSQNLIKKILGGMQGPLTQEWVKKLTARSI
jgi:hypothetical protein